MSPGDIVGHSLAGRYVIHQPDGVHLEARCTFGVKLDGISVNEIVHWAALPFGGKPRQSMEDNNIDRSVKIIAYTPLAIVWLIEIILLCALIAAWIKSYA